MPINTLQQILALLLLALPFLIAADNKPVPPVPAITAKFSPGGKRLMIDNNDYVIFRIYIYYCDGSVGGFIPTPFYGPYDGPSTYTDSKQMKFVELVTTNPDFLTVYEYYPLVKRVERGCNDETPPAKLYCNDVQLPAVIHRKVKEPIEFTSTRFVFSAGLGFPGVTGLVPIEKAESNHEHGFKPSLNYTPQSRQWKGTFPSIYVPLGSYHNVWLVVQDEFNQQAKCLVGDVNVLP